MLTKIGENFGENALENEFSILPRLFFGAGEKMNFPELEQSIFLPGERWWGGDSQPAEAREAGQRLPVQRRHVRQGQQNGVGIHFLVSTSTLLE